MRHKPSGEEPVEIDEEEERMFPEDREPEQEVQQIQQAVNGRKLFQPRQEQQQKKEFKAVEIPIQSRIAIITPTGKVMGLEEALAEILNSLEEIKQLAKE